MTQLSADEKVGKLFALAIIAETALGREVLKQRCDPNFDAKKEKKEQVDSSQLKKCIRWTPL